MFVVAAFGVYTFIFAYFEMGTKRKDNNDAERKRLKHRMCVYMLWILEKMDMLLEMKSSWINYDY